MNTANDSAIDDLPGIASAAKTHNGFPQFAHKTVRNIARVTGPWSLARQFLALSFPIVLSGALIIGEWVGQQVETNVVNKVGGVSALYVDSFIAPHVQSLRKAPALEQADLLALQNAVTTTALGNKIVALKIWRADGMVLFSTDRDAQGKTFRRGEGLKLALNGSIFSELSERSAEQQALHGQPRPRLIETYTPVRADHSGAILAVAEFYELPGELDREVASAQQRGWLVVAGTTLCMYLLLFLVVRRGSQVISNQQSDLEEKVRQLTTLNKQNLNLRERVVRAAEKSTAMNETFLQRVSTDLHDGPVQDLGFALMRLKSVIETAPTGAVPEGHESLKPARLALESALAELRGISSNLQLPDIEELSPAAIASRAVRDFQAKTGCMVALELLNPAISASFRTKVTLYRVLQESLANVFRHAAGRSCTVTLNALGQFLSLDVRDEGPGFDPLAASRKGRHGLRGMRQRVEVLGGRFEVVSIKGFGTQISVALPLDPSGVLS